MFFVLSLGLIAICLFGIKVCNKDTHTDYCDFNQTVAIRGVFAIVILLHHMVGYLEPTSTLDRLFIMADSRIGQLMVTPFLFYSGYGVTLGFFKRNHYVKRFIKNRVIKTWFHFALAVFLYLQIISLLGIKYPISQVLCAFIGWTSIGNSNWYIFDTIILYFGAFFSFLIARRWSGKKEKTIYLIVVFVFSVAFLFAVKEIFHKESWWWNTILAFPVGSLFYVVKDKLDASTEKSIRYWLFLSGMFLVFLITYLSGKTLLYLVASSVFPVILVLGTKKIKIQNKVLLWIGKYSFYTYIYMRMPMLVLTEKGITNEYVFCAVSIVSTVFLAWGMEKIQKKADQILKI